MDVLHACIITLITDSHHWSNLTMIITVIIPMFYYGLSNYLRWMVRNCWDTTHQGPHVIIVSYGWCLWSERWEEEKKDQHLHPEYEMVSFFKFGKKERKTAFLFQNMNSIVIHNTAGRPTSSSWMSSNNSRLADKSVNYNNLRQSCRREKKGPNTSTL